MSETKRTGSCLCGAVRVSAQPSETVGACHCNQCRKWGGGPLMTAECKGEVRFEGEEHITVYESSSWAERGFCSRCGSHLFWRMKRGDSHEILVGLFAEDDASWELGTQVYIDEKPAFYAFANKTKELTGAEVAAQYAE